MSDACKIDCPYAGDFAAERGRREVARWLLGVLVTCALAVGGWAHARLSSDQDRLTRLEAQRDGDRAALDAKLAEIQRRLDELRDLMRTRMGTP